MWIDMNASTPTSTEKTAGTAFNLKKLWENSKFGSPFHPLVSYVNLEPVCPLFSNKTRFIWVPCIRRFILKKTGDTSGIAMHPKNKNTGPSTWNSIGKTIVLPLGHIFLVCMTYKKIIRVAPCPSCWRPGRRKNPQGSRIPPWPISCQGSVPNYNHGNP